MWGKSRKKLENGEKASGASERKVPDVGLSSSHAFVHYLGTGGSGTNQLHPSLQSDVWSRRPCNEHNGVTCAEDARQPVCIQ